MNARAELDEMLKDIKKTKEDIKRLVVIFYIYGSTSKKATTIEELNSIYYDAGFGSQELYGYVVFNDGSWLERYEYDGSERWEYKETPTDEILNHLYDYLNQK